MSATIRGLGLLAILAGATPCAPAGTSDPGSFPFAVVQRGCAPWDGAATIIVLSDQPLDTAETIYPQLQISIWQSPDALHGKHIGLSDSATPASGTAMYCESKSVCPRVVSGWVRAGKVAGTQSVDGSYDLEFADHRHLAGSFKARWQHRQVLCG